VLSGPGFAAFPVLDPAIIGDVSLRGNVHSTDAGAMTQQVGGIARITIPYAPIGLTVTPVASLLADTNRQGDKETRRWNTSCCLRLLPTTFWQLATDNWRLLAAANLSNGGPTWNEDADPLEVLFARDGAKARGWHQY
jgi:hypothetical protein